MHTKSQNLKNSFKIDYFLNHQKQIYERYDMKNTYIRLIVVQNHKMEKKMSSQRHFIPRRNFLRLIPVLLYFYHSLYIPFISMTNSLNKAIISLKKFLLGIKRVSNKFYWLVIQTHISNSYTKEKLIMMFKNFYEFHL